MSSIRSSSIRSGSIRSVNHACMFFQLLVFGIALIGDSSVRGTTMVWTDDHSGHHRSLEDALLLNDTAKCYSTQEDDSPNR